MLVSSINTIFQIVWMSMNFEDEDLDSFTARLKVQIFLLFFHFEQLPWLKEESQHHEEFRSRLDESHIGRQVPVGRKERWIRNGSDMRRWF